MNDVRKASLPFSRGCDARVLQRGGGSFKGGNWVSCGMSAAWNAWFQKEMSVFSVMGRAQGRETKHGITRSCDFDLRNVRFFSDLPCMETEHRNPSFVSLLSIQDHCWRDNNCWRSSWMLELTVPKCFSIRYLMSWWPTRLCYQSVFGSCSSSSTHVGWIQHVSSRNSEYYQPCQSK